jgi:large subunit ribosomal protein L24
MTSVKLKIKKDDTVVVRTGKDKGKTGKVLRVMPTENRAVVQGINLVTKHRKPSQTSATGGIEKIEASIHISNLGLADPKSGKATRVGSKTVGDKKVRVAKKSGEQFGK